MKTWHVLFLGTCIIGGALWIVLAIDGLSMNISNLINAL